MLWPSILYYSYCKSYQYQYGESVVKKRTTPANQSTDKPMSEASYGVGTFKYTNVLSLKMFKYTNVQIYQLLECILYNR